MKNLLLLTLLFLIACSGSNSGKTTLWVYTSLYKDTIADLKVSMAKDFPDVELKWYQAGSEEMATKVNSEILAGNLQADIMISSDRFWYEELSQKGFLEKINQDTIKDIPASLKSPESHYSTVSLPAMVLIYNKDIVKNPPQSFKELADPKWKGKVSTGSPLASGTNFTTMAFLQKKYGWDYFRSLKANNTIAQGGNSAVMRRVQSGERPVGWILLENILRLVDQDKRIGYLYPSDGTVLHNNVLAITKKPKNREIAQKVAAWMFARSGQDAMVKSFMYSPFESIQAPTGAKVFSEVLAQAFPWSEEFLQEITKKRMSIKETYTKIMFK